MKRSPAGGACNRLNDDAVGKAVWSGSQKSTLTYDAKLFVFLGSNEVADGGFSILVKSDHSRRKSLHRAARRTNAGTEKDLT